MTKTVCNQRERRNERERKRVHEVNHGFNQLRDRVQRVSLNKKLSKADTLRMATQYIAHLKQILHGEINAAAAQSNTFSNTNVKPEFASNASFNPHSPMEYKFEHNQNNNMHYYVHNDSQ